MMLFAKLLIETIIYTLDWKLCCLTLSQSQALVFTCLQHKSFENAVGKGEIARNEQFLLFPQCFLPVWKTFAIFIEFEIVVCKLFQFGRV